ncbi:2-hydroxyacid dehydrogenase [Nocardia sp. NPDC052112]|uniref:2-hydroxyacid dehydrogenase n=1 Tax=Nocardia sp. NPDC052112 TaxID=3155646 RepID=UPI00343573BD
MKIVIADRNLLPHRAQFDSTLPRAATASWHPRFDETALIADLRDAEVYVGGTFTPAMAAAARELQLLHVAGAGTDGVAFHALAPQVQVANTFHHEQSIAEYVVASTILLRRSFLTQDKALRSGVWASSVYNDTLPQPPALNTARVGFVGFGHIGRQSWRMFETFGAVGSAVTGRGQLDATAEGLQWAADTSQLDRLLEASDVLVVSAPLDERTRGIIGAHELELLGPDGVLINVGRGPLVQEQALYRALSTSIIAAAAVDVWYDYPRIGSVTAPSALPFGELPNILMTPHSSGLTQQTFIGRTADITDNIGRLHRGEALRNTVRPAVGSKEVHA